MSVCGGFRGGFSFNPGMLTSMNFRHGCCCGGGGGLGGEQRQGLAARPDGAGACTGRSRSTRGAGTGGLGRLRVRLPDSPHERRPSPPRGRNAGVHTPGDFARALCSAGSEVRGNAGLGLGRGWGGPGGGEPATLSAGREGEPKRQPLGNTGTSSGKAELQSDAATSRLRASGASSLLGRAPGKAGRLEAVFFR